MRSSSKVNGFWLLIAGLATWRISNILTAEKIAEPLREQLGIVDMEGYVDAPDTFLAGVFSCLWCMSVWVGLAATITLLLVPEALLPFAFSAIAILVDRYNG